MEYVIRKVSEEDGKDITDIFPGNIQTDGGTDLFYFTHAYK